MTQPNSTLRAVRMGLLLSQDDMARALREAGERAGEPNGCNKRLVQRWESGDVASPRAVYARALESVTGLPIGALGFALPIPMARVSEDGSGGHDMEPAATGVSPARGGPAPDPRGAAGGTYNGVWLSRYEYFSSGRSGSFLGQHFVVVLQHGNRLTARSLPGSSDSPLTMDLVADRNIVTGTWTEQTAEDGYYQGARYHGAIQLLIEPTGRRMSGKWVGFGKEFDVNTGPWELVFKDASTTKATLAQYNRRPETTP
ncbi:XRE family transcriptional regulator [Streptomyces sp. SID3343]|uniref:XRE family transcriptional regulator n=1 Tax=Streptomyces sp. SID3343 TaxID=2690260 RepID=UPI00136F61FE|nr:XRE family transcriptional regulator [Streptomyces sp. SID3343]MYV99248.1 XRE family transcriptional regulator [Streptomyces sp. SID3343]